MTPVRSSKPSRLILIVAMVAAPVAALAQGTGVSPTDLHRYPLPTYGEDWRPCHSDHELRVAVGDLSVLTGGRSALLRSRNEDVSGGQGRDARDDGDDESRFVQSLPQPLSEPLLGCREVSVI